MTSSRAPRKSPIRLRAMVPTLSLLKDEVIHGSAKNKNVGAQPQSPVPRGRGKTSRATPSTASVTQRTQTPTRRGIGFPQCLTPTQRSPMGFSRITSIDSVNKTGRGFDTEKVAEDIMEENNSSQEMSEINDCGATPRKESLAEFLARSASRSEKKKSVFPEASSILSTTTVRATLNNMPHLPFEAKALFEGTKETIHSKCTVFAQLKFQNGKADVVYVKAPLLGATDNKKLLRPVNQKHRSFDELDVPCVRVNVTSSAA